MVPPGLGDGQFEVENGATLRVRLRPKAAVMRVHDGPADGQSHAETLGFGGVERLEEPLHIRRQSAALIPNGGSHPVLVQRRLEMKPARAGRIGGHGVAPLRMRLSTSCCSCTRSPAIGGRSGASSHTTLTPRPIRSALMRCNTSSMISVERERLQRNMARLEQCAQPLDDVARAAVRRHDVREDGLHFGHVRRFLEEQVLRGLGVAENDAERLVQLVSQ